MIRTNTPLRPALLAVTLAFLVGVFFLAPAVVANEPDAGGGINDDENGALVGKTGPGVGGKNGATGGTNGGQGDDGEADPDWFQNSSWTDVEMVQTAERTTVYWNVVVPTSDAYGQVVSWLLRFVSTQYVSFWR